MFVTRLISGIVMVILALLIIINGGWLLFGTMLLLSLIGVFELYRATGVKNSKQTIGIMDGVGYLAVILYYVSIVLAEGKFQVSAIVIGLIMIMFVYVFTYPKYQAEQTMAAVFSIVYVAVMLSFIYQTRMLEGGQFHVWLIFLASWGSDTCAYCAGRLLGKHKMAPVLSPKKSVEGAIGGFIGAVILGIIYAIPTHGPIIVYAIICGAGALISMVGDLAASAIKRNKDIKDYGRLIPGHGGVLDRFDSIIFTAPIIYFLAAALM